MGQPADPPQARHCESGCVGGGGPLPHPLRLLPVGRGRGAQCSASEAQQLAGTPPVLRRACCVVHLHLRLASCILCPVSCTLLPVSCNSHLAGCICSLNLT